MGEVYRARDARLGRDVAVKILPPAFAADPDRLSRFEQEARAAAALSHPNIAVVHDVGAEGATRYIVQEYLTGPSLRELLAEHSAKPLKDWVALAAAIADALAAAHRAGIIHRDIKPGNVIVTDEGRVKVLDFGLAKLTASGAESVSADSPTMLGTMAGAVLGTAGYMSPEQAAGQPADRRTDIFALGCVLYEMVAGRRPFDGRSTAEIIAHVLHDDAPTLSERRASVPPRLATLIHKCLQKDPARRYQHADDLAVDLRDEALLHDARPVASIAGVSSHPPRASFLWWLGALAAAVALAVFITWSFVPRDAGQRGAVSFQYPAAPSGSFNRVLAVAPDGRFVVINSIPPASGSQASALKIRWIDNVKEQWLEGAEEPRDPAISPDSQQIAFWSKDQIKRVPAQGGPVFAVGTAPGRPLGVSWADDGYIYYGRGVEGIWRIRAAGGAAERVKPAGTDRYLHGPQLLPGGWLLFTRSSRVNGWNDAEIVAARLGSDEETVLISPAHDARWIPGFLTYVHDSQLYVRRFDERTRQTSGEAQLLAERLTLSTMDTTGAAFYGISNAGVLAYIQTIPFQMTWREGGNETPLAIPPGRFSQVRISPDGRRIATRAFENGWHIVVYDIDRPTGTKLTTSGSNRDPVWSNDGEWIYYASDVKGGLDVWRRRADLGGTAELVYGAAGNQVPVGFAQDGELVFVLLDPGGSTIAKVNPSRPDSLRILVDRPLDAPEASLTRDGRWLAYMASAAGPWQVRVMDLVTGRHVTAADGYGPRWSPDGATLMYQTFQGVRLLSVNTSAGFAPGVDVLVPGSLPSPGTCDVANGKRVLVLKQPDAEGQATVVVNWPSLLSPGR
jgi:serine/threonine protein kinase